MSAAARPLAWVRGALAGWGWTQTLMGLLLGSLALFNMGALLLSAHEFNVPRAWLYNVLEFGLPGVLALRIADRAVDDGVPRVLAYGAAVLGVIVVGVWVIGPLLFPLIGGEPGWGIRQDLVLMLNLLLPFSIGALAYAHWRRGRQTLARVQAAERARAEAERELQSARLLALQSRVDPQFLFDALGRVGALIPAAGGPDPAEAPVAAGGAALPGGGTTSAAEDALAALIGYLRALQPATGATASTVAREFALVRAFGRAAGWPALLPPRLRLEADGVAADAPWDGAQADADGPAAGHGGPRPGPAARARLAPMVLLPALRALIGQPPEAPSGQAPEVPSGQAPEASGGQAPGAAWCVQARCEGEGEGQRLHLSVHPAEPAPASAGAALAGLDTRALQDRLRAVHGEDARVALRAGPAPALWLDLPLALDTPTPASPPAPSARPIPSTRP